MYRVGLYTLGCKVSLYETEAIGEAFEKEGFSVCPFDSVCDVYVINTCTVTAESDAKSRKYIRRAVRKNPDAVVAVVGCYSQRSPNEVAAIRGVSIVLGTADKLSVVRRSIELIAKRENNTHAVAVDTLENVSAPVASSLENTHGAKVSSLENAPFVAVSSLENAPFEHMTIERAPRTRAYVKIEDGCECRCTYCAISDARGPVRSKPKDDVIREVECLRSLGTKEIVLTGIETGSYGSDFLEKYDLADLICELSERKSAERIRLGSMAPELLGERFISRVGRLPILTPHFHVSMQSGSDNILRAMKRRYNLATAIGNIERIREYMPRVMFTADLMVGFPGESEEDFLATLEFVRRARPLDAHVFAYSKRRGTPAALYENQIPEDVKRERSAMLIREKNRVRDEVLDSVVSSGGMLSCIFESRTDGYFTAHSDSYIEVRAQSNADVSGELLDVKPLYHKDGIIYGEII